MRDLYDQIFKRKSFHLFRGVGNDAITEDELNDITEAFDGFDRLYPDIRTAIRVIHSSAVGFKRDAEYCILIYSEEKDNYLMNAGYIGEQLDLYLAEHDIGSLWFGLGKVGEDQKEYDGMRFVIMIAMRKVKKRSLYRKDMFKAKRKSLGEVWSGEDITVGGLGVGEVARFAPSACNSQPWYVEREDGALTVYRYRKPGRSGIMSASAASYFNRIDMGIYLCFLELCLAHNGIGFERALFVDGGGDEKLTKVAVYTLKK